MDSVQNWTVDDVEEWMKQNGFSAYIELLVKKHSIDGRALLMLQEDDLRNPPCAINVLGDRKRLLGAIDRLRLDDPWFQDHFYSNKEKQKVRKKPDRLQTQISEFSNSDENAFLNSRDRVEKSGPLKPEYTKLLVSYLYMISATFTTAMTMAIVHDRVPDMKKYPPLPDIMLDNLPYIPWAFEMCEFTGSILCAIWIIVLVFHKHRFILLRRMCSMTGTVFLLRCVTMIITSLSVPGAHLKCAPKTHGDLTAQLWRAWEIWGGFGMSLRGVRTCGDYMFSGHTVVVTMLNFLITEYTPRRFHRLHTVTWILNVFGIFFILAAHEHYSIDVFIAFYITSRLFLYYHSLANNGILSQQDRKRTQIWFPLLSYFESECTGIVPNEYEWPLRWPGFLKKYLNLDDHKHSKKAN